MSTIVEGRFVPRWELIVRKLPGHYGLYVLAVREHGEPYTAEEPQCSDDLDALMASALRAQKSLGSAVVIDETGGPWK